MYIKVWTGLAVVLAHDRIFVKGLSVTVPEELTYRGQMDSSTNNTDLLTLVSCWSGTMENAVGKNPYHFDV